MPDPSTTPGPAPIADGITAQLVGVAIVAAVGLSVAVIVWALSRFARAAPTARLEGSIHVAVTLGRATDVRQNKTDAGQSADDRGS